MVMAIRTTSLALLALAGIMLSACTPAAPVSNAGVEQAFASGGIIPVQPYTRSIFSSNNF